MSTPINLEKALIINGQPVYPPTTSQQVLMKDGRRLDAWLDGKYTLVHEVTTTEAVNMLVYDCNAKNIYFELLTPPNNEGSHAVGVVKVNGNSLMLYTPQMTANTTTKLQSAILHIDNGMILGSNESSTDGMSSTLNYGESLKYHKADGGYFIDSITKLEMILLNGRTFPTGTIFRVYEVK